MRYILIFSMIISISFGSSFREFVFLAGKHLNKSVVLPVDFDPKLEFDLSDDFTNFESVLLDISDVYDFELKITDNEIFVYRQQVETNTTSSFNTFNPPQYGNGTDFGVRVGDNFTPVHLFDHNISENVSKDYLYYIYQLRYMNRDDIDRLFSFSPFKIRYLENINSIVIAYEKKEDLDSFLEILKKADSRRDQVQVRLYIFESSRSELRNIGLDTSVNFSFSRLFEFGGTYSSSGSAGFGTSLKLLEDEGVAIVKNNPSFLLSNRQSLSFGSTTTIPYRLEDYSLSGDNPLVSSSRRYDYKEVGFKLEILPTIVGDDVYLDLDLNFDDVVSNIDNLPITAGKRIKNSFFLTAGQTMVLAGIEKETKSTSATGIPVLRSIPFIGFFFGTRSKVDKFDRFNIAIEFVGVDDVRID